MTVEIKELIIRATVSDKHDEYSDLPGTGEPYDKDELIAACVEQVLKIIERSKDR